MVKRFRKRYALTIAIGSSERRNQKRDPFGGEERRAMWTGYLREAGIRDVRVVVLRDGPSLPWAVQHMIRACRPDVVLLSPERRRVAAVVARCVRVERFQRRGSVSGTRIRDAIAAGDPGWIRLTGTSVARWILAHDGIVRIRTAYRR